MSHVTRYLTLVVMILAVGLAVTGCTGLGGGNSDSGSNDFQTGTLNVVLDYVSARVTVNGEELNMKLPDNATRFGIQLLDQNTGATLFLVNVERTQGVDTQVVPMTPIPVGNYNVRITAFDVDNNVIGVNTQAVTIQQGTNSITIATVTPTASPSVSPTVSPSPSPSPSVSPSPSPSPTP